MTNENVENISVPMPDNSACREVGSLGRGAKVSRRQLWLVGGTMGLESDLSSLR